MLKINKDYTNLNFKNKSELLSECKKLISMPDVLEPILKEIKGLRRGEVRPEDTKRRSEIGSNFSSKIQQIFNYVYLHKIVIKEDIITKLSEIIGKADAVLRENIVLQSKPPLDVIKFKNVPVRYSHSSFGRKEQRWGYGLNKLPTTDAGYSICMAIMPPRYIQSYHNHTITEYTLALDKKVIGIANPGKNAKKNIANTNEIVHFSATTPHTLYNPTNSLSRNVTVKLPTGLLDWRPACNLNPIKSTHSEILKGKLSRFGTKGGTKISFSIKDEYYDYKLELLQLKKDSVIENIYNEDRYIFVVDGELLISSGNIKKYCSKNDYIVVDKNTKFKIQTKTKSKLYIVINN